MTRSTTVTLCLLSLVVVTGGCKKKSSSNYSSTVASSTSSSTTTTGSGSSAGTSSNSDAPQLSAVDPNRGNPFGGTQVTVTGKGFLFGSKVRFGGVEATSVAVVSSDELTCVTPANPAGAVDLEVELPGGQILALANAFTYDPNAAPFGRVSNVGSPTPEEHELLELINRARKDPPAEGARLGLDFSAIQARPPLTHQGQLGTAALKHSQDMAARAFYGHVNPDNVGPVGRVLDEGYALHSRYGTNRMSNTIENVGAASGNLLDTPQKVHDAFMIDAGVNPPKHRELLLGIGNFRGRREAGFGYRVGLASTGPYSTFVSEELAASSRDLPLVLGSVYDDASNEGVYRAGEERANVPVTLTHSSGFTLSTTTNAVGAFAFEIYDKGIWTLTIDGKTTNVPVADDNVKVDLIDGNIRAN
ncbi:MAG TPA: hypothetical protein DEA08_03355 [Planctomycetes bacterium]|nr:hypothetical protein [Planctomycetota bacterium]